MGQTAQANSGYRNRGSLSQSPELQAICGAIFAKQMYFSLPSGKRLRTKLFKRELFAVDHQGLRYVEQNLKTGSPYAARARAGARIVWVIRPATNEWLGYIEDGTIWMK